MHSSCWLSGPEILAFKKPFYTTVNLREDKHYEYAHVSTMLETCSRQCIYNVLQYLT